MSQVEIYSVVGQSDWRWRVRADNGEIVASGEGYTRREDAERGYRAARDAMINATFEGE